MLMCEVYFGFAEFYAGILVNVVGFMLKVLVYLAKFLC